MTRIRILLDIILTIILTKLIMRLQACLQVKSVIPGGPSDSFNETLSVLSTCSVRSGLKVNFEKKKKKCKKNL